MKYHPEQSLRYRSTKRDIVKWKASAIVVILNRQGIFRAYNFTEKSELEAKFSNLIKERAA